MTTAAPVGPLGAPGRLRRRPGAGGDLRRAPRADATSSGTPDGAVRRPLATGGRGARRLRHRRAGVPARRARPPPPQRGGHLQRGRRRPQRPPALDARPGAARPRPGRVGRLERAVAQRSAVLDLVNADLYGERTLVARGLVPAEVVLGHPAFLRPCTGIAQPGANRLFLTAVDVVREADGGFRAVADRSQAPSGLGYSLVNRSALSRVLPTLHRTSGVERQAGFFRAIRAGMARAAPDDVDEPRVVILTPGPLSETYFEHAYLASYLGYPLVEGRDLVVQNNRVWLRSLSGLDPVDVVIRRVDDQWCDPVELRADSLLGVPGLLEVVRRGRVAVLNPLGSGILESPALAGLLADVAPALLGEELALRGPPELVVRTSRRPQPRAGPVRPAPAPARPARCRHPPGASRAPAAAPNGTSSATGCGHGRATGSARRSWPPRPCRRSTRTAHSSPDRWCCGPSPWPTGPTADHGFRLLPGGLTRVGADRRVAGHLEPGRRDEQGHLGRLDRAGAPAEPVAAGRDGRPRAGPGPRAAGRPARAGGGPAVHPGPQRRARRAGRAPHPHRAGPARPAPRHRARGGAQSLQVLLRPWARPPGSTRRPSPTTPSPSAADVARAAPSTEGMLPNDRTALALLFDEEVEGSLVSTLGILVEAAYSVREQLSADTWQLVSDIEEELGLFRRRPPTQFVGAQPSLLRLQRSLLALSGVCAENMERDSTWLFLDGGPKARAGPVTGAAPAVGAGGEAGRRGGGPAGRVAAHHLGEPDHLPAPVRGRPPRGRRPGPAGLRRRQPEERAVPTGPTRRPPGRTAQTVLGPAPGQRGAAGPRDDHPAPADRPRPAGRRRCRHRPAHGARLGLHHRRRPPGRPAGLVASDLLRP